MKRGFERKLLKSVFTFVKQPAYHNSLPVFDTWSGRHGPTRKKLRIEEWTKFRETFTYKGTSTNGLERNLCGRRCADDVPLLRSVECQLLLLCETCMITQHNYPHLDISEGWNCGTFILV